MPIAAAIAVAGIASASASVLASNKASKTAKDTATANNTVQTNTYNENKATLAPFVGTGTNATRSIDALLGTGGDPAEANAAFDRYTASTEYQSRLTQGQNSVTAGLGARGLLDSGAAQKALLKYGQTFGANEFGTYLGNLQQQQQTGLAAASAQAGVGQNYANAVSANNNNAANVTGQAALSNASALCGALNNVVGAYSLSQGTGSSYGGNQAGRFGVLGRGS